MTALASAARRGQAGAVTLDVVPLVARDLHRFYRRDGRVDQEVPALRGIDLAVHPGEIVAVTGPSGSGKSTLLALLAGLDEPSGGVVEVQGERLSHRPAADQARLRGQFIGVLTQGSALLGHLTVLANVQLAGAFRRPRPTAGAARDLLDALGLSARRSALPGQLSGGETARAGLACALLGQPAVLLADEPTAQLSRPEEADLLDRLRHLRPPGSATVLVTHSAAVAAMADRVLQLRDGRWT